MVGRIAIIAGITLGLRTGSRDDVSCRTPVICRSDLNLSGYVQGDSTIAEHIDTRLPSAPILA